MLKKNNIADFLFYFIVGTCYAWAITANIISTTVLKIDYFDAFLIIASLMVILLIVFYNRITMLTTLAGGLLAIIYIVADSFILKKPPEFFHHLYDVYLFITGYNPFSSEYTNTIIFSLSLLICIYTVIFLAVMFAYALLVIFGISIFFVTLIPGYSSIDIVFLVFLFSMVTIFIKKMNMAGSRTSNSRTMLVSLPFAALIIAGAYSIPTPATGTPVDIATLSLAIQKPYNIINDLSYGLFNPKYFSLQTAGFTSESGRLGGKIGFSNRYVMSVYSNYKPYLRGSVKDTYTGNAWLASESEFLPYSKEQDLINSLIFLQVVQVENITINIGTARTGTLFKPQNTLKLSLNEEYQIFTNAYGDMRTDKLMKRGTQYDIKHYSIDYADEIIQNQLRLADATVPEGYEKYVQLPETVTQRVRNLTHSITNDANSYYDKVKAVESFLIEYSYNLAPSDVPEDADFVDYFLFEGREGYCTYYASAMAVMCRILGLPTKYVEGYIMPDKQNEYGAYDVTTNQAHAWVEVYFDDCGWIAFEPTAPFYQTLYRNNTSYTSTGFNAIYNYFEDEMAYYNDMGISVPNSSQFATEVDKEDDEEDDEQLSSGVFLKFVILIAGLIGVVAVIVLVNLCRRLFDIIRIRRLNNGSAVSEYASKMLTIAAILGYPISFNESADKYGRRIGKYFSFQNEKYFLKDVLLIFSKVRYGNKDISQSEKEFVAKCCKEMTAKAKKSLKIYEYLFYRYIAYRF